MRSPRGVIEAQLQLPPPPELAWAAATSREGRPSCSQCREVQGKGICPQRCFAGRWTKRARGQAGGGQGASHAAKLVYGSWSQASVSPTKTCDGGASEHLVPSPGHLAGAGPGALQSRGVSELGLWRQDGALLVSVGTQARADAGPAVPRAAQSRELPVCCAELRVSLGTL